LTRTALFDNAMASKDKDKEKKRQKNLQGND